jgi:hypothetical protein
MHLVVSAHLAGGMRLCRVILVQELIMQAGRELAAADRLRGLAREQFIGQLAEFLADVNALHAFRRATVAPSVRSCPSWLMTPAITSNGCAWILLVTSPLAPQPTRATSHR